MRWSVPRIWEGSTVVIIGGGPSVNDHDLSRLQRHRAIAVNSAYRVAPWSSFLYFRDGDWWYRDGHDEAVAELYGGTVVTTHQGLLDHPWVKCLGHGPQRTGLNPNPEALVRGNHAGHEAIDLAVHLGAARIVLLGYDMTREHGDNFHNSHKRTVDEQTYSMKFKPNIEDAAAHLAAKGIAVVNVSRISKLECFPRVDTLEEVGL